MARPVLHDYWRSSAAYRVRIALNLKGIEYDSRTVNLAAGDQRSDDYRALNPQGLIPMLEIDGHMLKQSMAIIGYLDQRYPNHPLLPADAFGRSHVLSLALTVACDTHPVNNLRVLKYLSEELGADEGQRNAWYRHWVSEGLAALDKLAASRSGDFLFGDRPTMADICLVPQLYNARRFDVPLDGYPTLLRADSNAAQIEAFAAAHPDQQEKPE